jgi:hypothetical protein
VFPSCARQDLNLWPSAPEADALSKLSYGRVRVRASSAPPGTRTPNLLIKSQLLYQLS